MRILFVLPRLVSGGVERVTLNLIEEFCKAEHDCLLALGSARGELLDEARKLVEVRELAPSNSCSFVPNLSRLIKQWQPTHVVTAFSDVAVMVWLAMKLAGRRVRWIHGVHNTHASITSRAGAWGAFRYWLDIQCAAFVYRRAGAIVAVSEGVRSEVVNRFRIAAQKVVTIHNPVIRDDHVVGPRKLRRDPNRTFAIVALGRLSRQKGFDLLIEAMSAVPPPWHLDIWGEGEERRNLESQISQHGFEHSVRLCGHTDDPFEVLRAADLFVLPSRHEGLPTVLIEAISCQCQIVAADCPHGPREILQDGMLGLLVEAGQVGALSVAVQAVIAGISYADPDRMLQRAADFTFARSSTKWLQVLELR